MKLVVYVNIRVEINTDASDDANADDYVWAALTLADYQNLNRNVEGINAAVWRARELYAPAKRSLAATRDLGIQ